MSVPRSARLAPAIALATAAALILTIPTAATAAGVGDTSAAVIYDVDGPIGSVLTGLSDQDDASETVALPFPINFFGTSYGALCVTTNGYAVPVLTSASACSAGAYDQNLQQGALATNQSMVGVLTSDLNLASFLWVDSVALASIESAAGVTTIGTTAPHGYAVGDQVEARIAPDDVDYGDGFYETVSAVTDATHFSFVDTIADFPARVITGATGRPFDGVTDDSDADGLADDGFGAVQQVYAGTAVVDGKNAFVVTWYRVNSYEADNNPTLFDTFQLVFVQEATANGATVGFDTSIMLNFGTVHDIELGDGYDVTAPTNECPVLADCRFAAGLVSYTPLAGAVPESAVAYELFAGSSTTALSDGGATPLVRNSLNSGLGGRYILTMVGGVVANYAVPVMTAGPVAAQLAETGVRAEPVVLTGALLLLAGAALLLMRRRLVVD